MKFLQIGLGSMGKRRIRNLNFLGYTDIIGFDIRKDRREEAVEKYFILIVDDISKINFSVIDAVIISTPPDRHTEYIEMAMENNKPVFVEASTCLDDLEKLNILSKKKNIIVAPSCTALFYPPIKKINKIVKSKKYGKVTNFIYHLGQYLPDWHPWENIKDYYVGKKETGGAKEMVAFELIWLTNIFGFPTDFRCIKGKTMDLGVDIDDTYAILINLEKGIGVFLIDVVSRYADKSLLLNMEKGQIVWKWDDNVIKLYDSDNKKWINIFYDKSGSYLNYNKNISENMYVDELNSFINFIFGKGKFLNNLDNDIKILKLLEKFDNEK